MNSKVFNTIWYRFWPFFSKFQVPQSNTRVQSIVVFKLSRMKVSCPWWRELVPISSVVSLVLVSWPDSTNSRQYTWNGDWAKLSICQRCELFPSLLKIESVFWLNMVSYYWHLNIRNRESQSHDLNLAWNQAKDHPPKTGLLRSWCERSFKN